MNPLCVNVLVQTGQIMALVFYYMHLITCMQQMSKPLGTIPLRGLSVLALDNEGDTEPRPLTLTPPPATNGSSEGMSPRSKQSSK